MCGDTQVDDESKNPNGSTDEKSNGQAKQFDPNFKGPTKNRSCTDIICCLLFLMCVTGSILCTVFGYIYGNPHKLIYPTDSNGTICGMDTMKSKPNMMFFDILQCTKTGVASIALGCPTPQVCIEKCPSSYYFFIDTISKEVQGEPKATARSDMICVNGINAGTSSKSVNELVGDEECARYYLPSNPVVGRCIPSIFEEGFNEAKELVTSNSTLSDKTGTKITGTLIKEGSMYLAMFMSAVQYIEMIFRDILASWYLILVFMGLTMVVALLWIVIMRWIAGIMVWLSIFAFIALLTFATGYCVERYVYVKNNSNLNNLPVVFTTNFSYYMNLKETWLALGIVSGILLLIALILMLFLCQRIRIAIELFKEASRAIGGMIFTLFWPIFPFVFQIGVFAYYVFSAVYVASMGPAEFLTNGTNKSTDGGLSYFTERTVCTPNISDTLNNVCNFVKYGGDQYIIPMQVYLLFMFFWLMNFVIAVGQLTLAGAFSSYYWAWNKPQDIPTFPLLSSFYRCFRYHLGSLAFGSLIIAIVQMIRVFLEYLDHKVKGSENCLAKFFIKCLKCCFWCLEKFIKFINRNAYIMIAVHGKNFCFSAKDAFFLLVRNIVRTVVLNKITDFLLFISKITVTAAAISGSFFWFQGKVPFFENYVPTLNYFLAPVILVGIGAYLIASSFFSVYAMAVDTLFLCFLEDLERHDGSADKPYFMSKGLMKILGKKNKFSAEK